MTEHFFLSLIDSGMGKFASDCRSSLILFISNRFMYAVAYNLENFLSKIVGEKLQKNGNFLLQ